MDTFAIFEESFKLLPKNGKFMALIALSSAILYSSLFLVFYFSNISLFSDMLLKQYSSSLSGGYGSGSSAIAANPYEGILKDARLLLLIDVAFIIGMYIVLLFITITTVIISAASYSNKILTGKELVVQVAKSWIRLLITSFYTILLAIGYLFVVIIFIGPLLIFSRMDMILIAMAAAVVAYFFYLYLNVVWVMALVVSLTEKDYYGVQALGRAEVLLEGKKLQGFILSTSLSLLSLILSAGLKSILGKKVMANQTVFWISASILMCLMKIFLLAAYTILYFRCKMENGEEMELQGSVSYKKLSPVPPFSDAA